ncbi:flavodoxin family protein [uncultured Methanobrevibacter sp.]|uniref:flavodoxin family protein n=1 Tax=uncultured Methanobrevibacter sp. TaxID=253161 RepID=UPI0026248404|nr:flavodoxin family protein [uncultured Methanobrevibacter sp.]
MKVLLFNGSPHKKGCTYTALTEITKSLNENDIETEIFWVGTKPVLSCMACGKCAEIGKCTFGDDKVNEFVEKAYDADGFVFGTPVHYAAASGATTAFLDRAFYSNGHGTGAEAFRFKPAAGIVSARRSGTTATFDQLNKYMTITQMPIISSVYWNAVHGNTPEEVMQDEEGLFTMRQIGKNMAYFLKCIEAGREKGLEPDMSEAKPRTNFIR